MTVTQQLVKHYSSGGNAPYSVEQLLALHGRKWLKDVEDVIAFKHTFCICRDGIVRSRYGMYGDREQE